MFVETHRPVAGSLQQSGLQNLYSALPEEHRIEIQMSNLTKEVVSQLLCRLLRREAEDTKSLVEAIHGRTGGNPFL